MFLKEIWEDELTWIIFRVRGTVILKIWRQILLFMVYTTILLCFHNFVNGFRINFPIALVFVLGAVTGLLLVFRTTTAYDRYWEGRGLWAKMHYHTRSLTRVIWAGVVEPEPDESEGEEKLVHHLLERLTAINLLVAFAYATMNHLREEYSYEEENIKYKICHLPKFRKFISQQSKNSPNTILSGFPTISDSMNNFNGEGQRKSSEGSPSVGSNDGSFKRHQKSSTFYLQAHATNVPTNIPIEISYYLYAYLKSLRKRGIANNTNCGLSYWSLSVLIECLTGFERIARTPIPIAYNVHLEQCVFLYLLSVPFQLIGFVNWLAIPAMAVASFALLGIMGIGAEIENPFGYDDNDLPLDTFCQVIQEEIQVILGHPMPNLESWTLSNYNLLLSPHSDLSANDLINRPMSDLRGLLADRLQGK